MSLLPTVLIANTSHGASNGSSYNGTDTTWYSSPVKAAGYYGSANSSQTAFIKVSGLNGTIKLQASLATTPTAQDWFDINSTILSGDNSTPLTNSSIINFNGNFVWVRVAVINFAAGTIDKVIYN